MASTASRDYARRPYSLCFPPDAANAQSDRSADSALHQLSKTLSMLAMSLGSSKYNAVSRPPEPALLHRPPPTRRRVLLQPHSPPQCDQTHTGTKETVDPRLQTAIPRHMVLGPQSVCWQGSAPRLKQAKCLQAQDLRTPPSTSRSPGLVPFVSVRVSCQRPSQITRLSANLVSYEPA